MYEIFADLVAKKGVRVADVAKATGIRTGVFSDWKMGRYTPKQDKLKLINANLYKLFSGTKKDRRSGQFMEASPFAHVLAPTMPSSVNPCVR